MKKLQLFLILVFFWASAQSQTFDSLEVNNLKVGLHSDGILFRNYSGKSVFKIKDANDLSVAYSGSIWIGTKTDSGVYVADETFRANPANFDFGPVTDDYSDSLYAQRFDKVWKISKAEIDQHRQDFSQTGYSIPKNIWQWPAHGDVSKGQSWILAPFVDLNNNGVYEPQDGEYPEIRGDEALFAMFHDSTIDTLSPYPTLGIEIHQMMYAYTGAPNSALFNTVFVNYKIYNHSNQNLDSLKIGIWADFDIGNGADDLMGCDSISGLCYAYNASNNDSGPNGFGNNPPAVGSLNLNGSTSGFLSYSNSGSTGVFQTKDPWNDEEAWQNLNIRWKDSTSVLVENPSGLFDGNNGDGHEATNAGQTTNYLFNDQLNWYDSPARAGDKRSLSTLDFISIPVEGKYCFDQAYLYARDTSGSDSYASVVKLKANTQQIQSFFDSQAFPCLGATISLAEKMKLFKINAFPNPVSDKLIIESSDNFSGIELYNLTGQKMLEKKGLETKRIEIELDHLPKGIYLIHAIGQFGIASTKIQVD